ncbi:hypothetical protein LTR86_005745 [Recurvomyces mirabilis]|nr:hypothetical protein LTR86_005745 [Recurvomyces mirabilis]
MAPTIPQDLLGRYVIARQESRVPAAPGSQGTGTVMKQKEHGYVTDQSPDNTQVRVTIDGREQKGPLRVYLNCLEAGCPREATNRRCRCTTSWKDDSRAASDRPVQMRRDDLGDVLEISNDNMRAKVQVHPTNPAQAFDIIIPCSHILFAAPLDLKGRMFRARKALNNPTSDFKLAVGDMGTITAVESPRGEWVTVKVLTGPKGEGKVPIECLEFGRRHGKWRITEHLPSVGVLQTKAPDFDGRLKAYDFRHHISTLLTCLWEDRDLIDWKDKDTWLLMDTDEKRRLLTVELYDGIKRRSKDLIALFEDATRNGRSITVEQILAACKEVQSDDHFPCIYLKAYSNFREKTDFHGHDPYHYVGQTIDCYQRISRHKASATNSNDESYRSKDYRVYRSADTRKNVVVWAADDAVKAGDTKFRLRLDLFEEIIMLMTKSTAAWIFAGTEVDTNQLQAVEAAKNTHHKTYNGKVLRIIAAKAFKKSGWLKSGTQSLGSNGLNVLQPIGSESTFAAFERVLFTRIETPKMLVFARPPVILRAQQTGKIKTVILMQLRSSGKEKAVEYAFDNADNTPPIGTTVWPQIEIMKQGMHAVPFAALPTAGGWSNWLDALAIGVRISWQHGGQWYTRMVRSPMWSCSASVPGEVTSYKNVIALRTYLMREMYDDRPDSIPELGPASVAELRVDMFDQKITARQITETVRRTSPTLNPDNANAAMQKAGLQNVGASKVEGGKLLSAQGHQARKERGVVDEAFKTMTSRKKCDNCLVHPLVLGLSETGHRCEVLSTSTECYHCWRQGKRCSWTPYDLLLGSDFLHNVGGPMYRRMADALVLYESPDTLLHTKPAKIDDPGFRTIGKSDWDVEAAAEKGDFV